MKRLISIIAREWLLILLVTAVIAALVGIAVFSTGCTGFLATEKGSTLKQEQRESVVGKATSDLMTAAKSNPPNVTITATDGDGMKVEVVQPVQGSEQTTAKSSASENSDSAAAGFASAYESIPLGIKLALLGIGIIVLVGAVVWAARKFHLDKLGKAVVNATTTTAAKTTAKSDEEWGEWIDAKLKELAHNLRTQQTNETKPEVLAILKTQEAETQRLRAEVVKPTAAVPA